MRNETMLKVRLVTACLTALATVFSATTARSDAPRQVTPNPDAGGFASVYGSVPPDQVEFLSTPESIKSVVASGAPTAVWEVLEHGEKVECLDCVSAVGSLLYDANAKTREIAAWWLRRRILGVFGPGEVYAQTLDAVKTAADPVRRAYAASALGEFLASPGAGACATALGDPDPRVRAAAATALGRLNSDGMGALSSVLGDPDRDVKLAALGSATIVAGFSGVANVAALTKDPSTEVRRRALEVLGALGSQDALAAILAAAQTDIDAGVRTAACHALGSVGARSPGMTAASTTAIVSVLNALAQNDPNGFVRDQAQIAARRF